MQSQIVELDPPRRLGITWGQASHVSFELEPRGKEVLLTIVHSRLPSRSDMLMVGAGWHMHLDILLARTTGRNAGPFWEGWTRLKQEYDRRLPA